MQEIRKIVYLMKAIVSYGHIHAVYKLLCFCRFFLRCCCLSSKKSCRFQFSFSCKQMTTKIISGKCKNHWIVKLDNFFVIMWITVSYKSNLEHGTVTKSWKVEMRGHNNNKAVVFLFRKEDFTCNHSQIPSTFWCTWKVNCFFLFVWWGKIYKTTGKCFKYVLSKYVKVNGHHHSFKKKV